MSQLAPLYTKTRMTYETPAGGITLGAYVARRLHKTALLRPVPELLAQDSARALAQIALYAAAASTSFGTATYQPASDPVGAIHATTDPETGAQVTVTCESGLRFSYRVVFQGVGILTGAESISGTTLGRHGLGMPAPSAFVFVGQAGQYSAKAIGVMTSELAPGLGRWRIRGQGALDLSDSAGNRGRLSLDRSGLVFVSLTACDGHNVQVQERLV